jgi:pSer/pThr/pTyr-binding forkhead associated (FHA) protein
MSTADPNRKTLRHFYCRDALWHSFERMSEDLDRGVDELVNEAMRVYAREKGYLPTESDAPRGAPGRPVPPAPPPPRRPAPPPPPAPSSLRTTAAFHGRAPTGGNPYANHGPARGGIAEVEISEVGEDSASPPIYLVFQNQKYLIDKEQFIIGRGSKSSDLPIRDGNISRKHAAVLRRNGSYYIKDLGSTNGIDFNGVRIDNKRIEEGDTFTICDYELKFTFR